MARRILAARRGARLDLVVVVVVVVRRIATPASLATPAGCYGRIGGRVGGLGSGGRVEWGMWMRVGGPRLGVERRSLLRRWGLRLRMDCLVARLEEARMTPLGRC